MKIEAAPSTEKVTSESEPVRAYVNAASNDGDIDFGSVEITPELVREAISSGSVTTNWTESTITINLGPDDGLSIHIFISD